LWLGFERIALAAREPIETRTSSAEIRDHADDLEIPVFLRKRGEG